MCMVVHVWGDLFLAVLFSKSAHEFFQQQMPSPQFELCDCWGIQMPASLDKAINNESIHIGQQIAAKNRRSERQTEQTELSCLQTANTCRELASQGTDVRGQNNLIQRFLQLL